MKTRNIIFVLSFILFNSCIVKSLHPFYTKETISFKKELLGKWKGNFNSTWEIIAFKKEFLKEKKAKKLSQEDVAILAKHKDSYFVKVVDKEKVESYFLVTPFTISNQLFLDFIPLGIEDSNLNSLTMHHIVYSHSLVKLDLLKNDEIEIKWFDEKRIKELFDENRIKIKHEKIGIMDEDIVLTASSKEIQAFLKKYLTTESAKKWETSTKFTLTKS